MGTTVNLEPRLVSAFFAREVAAWDEYNDVVQTNPPEGLALVRALVELAHDDRQLCWVGVALLEQLIAHHGTSLVAALEEEAAGNVRFREAVSCVEWSGLPAVVGKRLLPLLRAEDYIDR